MTVVPAPLDDQRDRRFARRSTGALRVANLAGVLQAADVHVAERLARACGEPDEAVLLAVALTVRAVRQGSVCLDLETVPHVEGLTHPEPAAWLARVEASTLAAQQVLRVDAGLVYLDRYWAQEAEVVTDLSRRRAAPAPVLDPARLESALEAYFPAAETPADAADAADPSEPSQPGERSEPAVGLDYREQRAAARLVCGQWTSVVTGGPGTGKTTTIARLLGSLIEASDRPPRIALAAPTGKAAARMTQALREAVDRADFPSARRDELGDVSATTIHRLLGWRPDSRTRFRHDRGNPLPHDVVVVDETSMVSLTLMARLLEAMRPEARLVLVGDADQLASVDAGAVLHDLVDGLGTDSGLVARLGSARRYGSAIDAVAEAIRRGDADAVLHALERDPAVRLVPERAADDVVREASEHLLAAARAGEGRAALAALDRHRLLVAHRSGDYGVSHWNRRVERWLQERLGVDWLGTWYAGQPLLVTTNDYGLGLFNGDTGLVVRRAPGDSFLVARMADGSSPSGRELPLSRLADVETAHAMTVHRSQGSQFEAVTVVLPPPESPLLTRELLHTAVTRAQSRVTVVGSVEAVRAAVERPALRASGLARRLGEHPRPDLAPVDRPPV